MSAEPSDSRSSGASPSTSATKKKADKPPFKLCFSKQQESGRSDASVGRITANFVAPKFYSRESDQMRKVDVEETVKEIGKQETKKPKDVYRWPLLTSHMYGWWHDKGIRPSNARFNYHKKTSDLVSYRMRIFAEDNKLKGLGH